MLSNPRLHSSHLTYHKMRPCCNNYDLELLTDQLAEFCGRATTANFHGLVAIVAAMHINATNCVDIHLLTSDVFFKTSAATKKSENSKSLRWIVNVSLVSSRVRPKLNATTSYGVMGLRKCCSSLASPTRWAIVSSFDWARNRYSCWSTNRNLSESKIIKLIRRRRCVGCELSNAYRDWIHWYCSQPSKITWRARTRSDV